jgi:hypothetical protein
MKLSFLLFALSLFLGQGVSQSKRDLKSPSLRKAIAVGHVEKHQGHQDLTASIKAVESEAVHTDVNMTVSHYVARRLEATKVGFKLVMTLMENLILAGMLPFLVTARFLLLVPSATMTIPAMYESSNGRMRNGCN